MTDLLLRGGRPWGRDAEADILVRDGVIERIGPKIDGGGAQPVDLAGRLVLPGLVDAHCHLDKTLYGRAWVPHSAGDALADRIATDRRRRAELGLPNVDSIVALLEQMVGAGTAYARSHVDVDPEVGLRGVEAVREAVARLDGRITVELVAFPQHGVLTNPGTADLLEEALKNGVETVGGIDPAGFDRDPVRHLDVVFGLAERYGAGVDIHLHDGGLLDEAHQDRLIHQLAEAGVTLVTAAVYSFPVPPIRKLRAAGVNVACGHDGIRDLWGPYGSGDMLDRAMHVAYRSTFRRDEDIELALEAASHGGARALGLPAYGLTEGAPADLVVVAASTPAEAVVARPPRELVLKAGRVVARAGAVV
jgi:cytosine/creatinine deaminase